MVEELIRWHEVHQAEIIPFLALRIQKNNGGNPFDVILLQQAFMKWIESEGVGRMVLMPLKWMYRRSLSVNLNRDRNLEFLRAVRAVVIWSVTEKAVLSPNLFSQPISSVPDAEA